MRYMTIGVVLHSTSFMLRIRDSARPVKNLGCLARLTLQEAVYVPPDQ
jgi:hypothetical protein